MRLIAVGLLGAYQETSEKKTKADITSKPTEAATTVKKTEADTTVKQTEAETTVKQTETEKTTKYVETETTTATSRLVWTSATGSKYHAINDCGNMNPKKARQMTEEEAQEQGYEPCKKCYYILIIMVKEVALWHPPFYSHKL